LSLQNFRANRSQKISVQVFHENPLISIGLVTLLGGYVDIALTTGAPWTDCDIVVTDYHDGLRRLQHTGPHQSTAAQRVLIVTEQDREWNVRTAVTAGVHGYLLQSCGPEELEVAVRSVGRGLRYLSPVLSRCLADSMSRTRLTGRESDVLRLLARGSCNKTIARELGIGVGTVKTYVKAILHKLGVTARTHAVVVAAQRGMI
jgi:two-component system NarL family response regulator